MKTNIFRSGQIPAFCSWIAPAVIILVVMLLGVIANWSFSHEEVDNFRANTAGDSSNYIRMAETPLSPVENPFALRLLTPTIVRVLKKNSNHLLGWSAAWLVISFLCTYFAAIFLYRLLREQIKLSRPMATLWTIFQVHNFGYTLFHLYNPFLVDPFNNLVWSGAIYCLFANRYRAFCIWVMVGFVNKETALFLLPLYPMFVIADDTPAASKRAPAIWRSLIACVGIMALYLGYRFLVASLLDPDRYQLFTAGARSVAETIAFSVNHQKNLYAIYGVFGFLWVMFFISLYRLYREKGWQNRWVMTALYLLAVLLFGRLFASDADRVFVMMSPVVVALAARYFIQRFERMQIETTILLLLIYTGQQMDWLKPATPFLVDILVLWGLLRPLGADEGACP